MRNDPQADHNHEEEIMKGADSVTIGFIVMTTVTGIVIGNDKAGHLCIPNVQMKRFSLGLHGPFIRVRYMWLCNTNKNRNDLHADHNHEEEIMKGTNRVIIGFIATMAVTGIVNGGSSFASDAGQVAVTKRIGHGGSTYQLRSGPVSVCQAKGDVIERIGAGGSTYSSSQSSDCPVAEDDDGKTATVIERIGAGGSTYSSSQPLS